MNAERAALLRALLNRKLAMQKEQLKAALLKNPRLVEELAANLVMGPNVKIGSLRVPLFSRWGR